VNIPHQKQKSQLKIEFSCHSIRCDSIAATAFQHGKRVRQECVKCGAFGRFIPKAEYAQMLDRQGLTAYPELEATVRAAMLEGEVVDYRDFRLALPGLVKAGFLPEGHTAVWLWDWYEFALVESVFFGVDPDTTVFDEFIKLV
jgi:hypothetical protein